MLTTATTKGAPERDSTYPNPPFDSLFKQNLTVLCQLLVPYLSAKQISQLTCDATRLFTATQAWNSGQRYHNVPLQFFANELGYHQWEHTLSTTCRLFQLIPGFLKKYQNDNQSHLYTHIRTTIFGTVIHDLGYLLKKQNEHPVYQLASELSYDHVNRGVELAPAVLRLLKLHLDPQEVSMVQHAIRATDFNIFPWQAKCDHLYKNVGPIAPAERPWAKLVEVADFLAAFADFRNIPRYVWQLYWENQARVVQNGLVMTFDRDHDGKIRWQDYKPVLVPSLDPDNDYATVDETKNFLFDRRLIEENPYEVPTKGLYDYVASTFLGAKRDELLPFVAYADTWFTHLGRPNEIRTNYDTNLTRVAMLQDIHDEEIVDPLSIFEGAFTGHKLAQIVSHLKREELISDSFHLEHTYLNIDMRVIWGILPDHTKHAKGSLNRLVTAELREILNASTRPCLALAHIFDHYRQQMRGEKTNHIFLNIAPGAYTSKLGPFGDFVTTTKTIAEICASLPIRADLPTLHMVITIRQDKDFDITTHAEIAKTINTLHKSGKIAGAAFLGLEKAHLSEHQELFDGIASSAPLTILIGQSRVDANPTEEEKHRFVQNVLFLNRYIDRTQNNIPNPHHKPYVWLWGMQLLRNCSYDQRYQIRHATTSEYRLLRTPMYDQMIGFQGETEPDPLGLLGKQSATIMIGTANQSLSVIGGIQLQVLEQLLGPDGTHVPYNYRQILAHNGHALYKNHLDHFHKVHRKALSKT